MSTMPSTPSADHSHDRDGEGESAAGHGHHHANGPANYDRAFAVGTLLNLGFVIAEAGFGLLANSMAMLADAGHNLSDVLSLLLAWGAAWLTRRRPTSRHTYGFGSSSILASLTNAMLLLVAVGAIAVGAIGRLFNPEPVAEGTVIWV
ncbi:MAG TPA: cation diffusion facilitator family transporter, partial [Dongiaceae bacterium]